MPKIRREPYKHTPRSEREMHEYRLNKAYMSFNADKILPYQGKEILLKTKKTLKIPSRILAPLRYCLVGPVSSDEFLIGVYRDQPHPDLNENKIELVLKNGEYKVKSLEIIPNSILEAAMTLFTQHRIKLAYVSYYKSGKIKAVVYNVKFSD